MAITEDEAIGAFRRVTSWLTLCAIFAVVSGVSMSSVAYGAKSAAGGPVRMAKNGAKHPPVDDMSAKLDQYWQRANETTYKSVKEVLAQDATELARGIKHHKFMQGTSKRKEVAITFDDGPHPRYTPRILEILKRYNAKATFFVVGMMAEKAPELIRAEVAAGHNVANHTYHHVNLTRIPEVDVALEIRACGTVIERITGMSPHLFRPPGGDYDTAVAEAAEAMGYTMVLWTDDPGDYASPGAKVIEKRLLKRIGNGGIVLIHDGVQQTIDLLPQILQSLMSRGYKFVTIDEMIGDSRFGQ